MKLFFFLFLLSSLSVQAQVSTSQFDPKLADSLGADDYGMKQYVFVILKSGPVTLNDNKVVDSLFRGHLKNINRLADEGKLIIAGPLGKNDLNYRGIFVLNVPSLEEAKALVNTDPAIKAGLLACDFYSWYGSAALPMYLPYHTKVEKKGF